MHWGDVLLLWLAPGGIIGAKADTSNPQSITGEWWVKR